MLVAGRIPAMPTVLLSSLLIKVCRWQLASKWHRGPGQIKVVRPQLIHIAALECHKRVYKSCLDNPADVGRQHIPKGDIATGCLTARLTLEPCITSHAHKLYQNQKNWNPNSNLVKIPCEAIQALSRSTLRECLSGRSSSSSKKLGSLT